MANVHEYLLGCLAGLDDSGKSKHLGTYVPSATLTPCRARSRFLSLTPETVQDG